MATVVQETSLSSRGRLGADGFLMGGYTGAAITGFAAVVLSIIGLAGVASPYVLGISAIVLGVGLLLEGGLAAAGFSRIRTLGLMRRVAMTPAVGGGLSAEGLAGIGAIVLGALALLGVVPLILLAIAAIVLGAGFLLGSGVLPRLTSLELESSVEVEAQQPGYGALKTAVKTAVDSEVLSVIGALVGVAGVVLGILGLVGVATQALSLVAMLAFGCATIVGALFANW